MRFEEGVQLVQHDARSTVTVFVSGSNAPIPRIWRAKSTMIPSFSDWPLVPYCRRVA